jgi:hypothetical protein
MKRIILTLIILFCGINLQAQTYSGDKPFSNPSFMYGTNIGQYFQTLYRLGKYDDMLKFTSQESIKKYGKDKILDYYRSCDFGYKIKINNRTQDGKYIILSYDANIMATNKVVRIKTVIENDSAKVVLNNLNILY